MDKINKKFKKLSLKKTLLVISTFVLVIVTLLSVITMLTTSKIRQDILDTRTITIKNSDNQTNDDMRFHFELSPENYTYGKLTEENQIYYYIITFFMVVLPIFYVIIGSLAVVKIYFRVKLSTPIEQLRNGITHIVNYDLDFEMNYCSDDELGVLCGTFENMRKELISNNQKMWNVLQERKALTASVSHDLRTPITVIKGYLDYLEKAISREQLSSESLRKTIQSMTQSTERLERYVNCIQDIQKIEDIEIKKASISILKLATNLERDFSLLAKQQQRDFKVYNETQTYTIYSDEGMLFKILENIFNNALRFSKNIITLTIKDNLEYLEFIIQDDGEGFTPEELVSATSLFYSSSTDISNYGIGLSICKILCEKMNGKLKIENMSYGGACITMQLKK